MAAHYDKYYEELADEARKKVKDEITRKEREQYEALKAKFDK